jgi:micrococcal nuclease
MYQYKCKINKVLDGDTVDIDLDLGFNIVLSNQRVRMAGVDTPESRTAKRSFI